jgi:hypothetical protein
MVRTAGLELRRSVPTRKEEQGHRPPVDSCRSRVLEALAVYTATGRVQSRHPNRVNPAARVGADAV